MFVEVFGTADADEFASARLEIGAGDNPTSFERVGADLRSAVRAGKLGEVDAQALASNRTWTLQLVTTHRNGRTREMRFLLNVG